MSVRMSVILARYEPNSHFTRSVSQHNCCTSCFDITREKLHALRVQNVQAAENSVTHVNFGAFSRLFRKS
jgi:hypothetical protein